MTAAKDLASPPIDEVVCGVRFEPVRAFSAPEHGRYWASREKTFPKSEQREPVLEEGVPIPLPWVRTWLMSEDETRLVQLQHDRFYANWRRRNQSDPYPHFKDRGSEPGIRTFVCREYRQFADYMAVRFGTPKPTSVELSKIDVLYEGHHWRSNEIGQLLPILAGAAQSRWVAGTGFNLRFAREADGTTETLAIDTGRRVVTEERVIRIEIRVSSPMRDNKELEHALGILNDRANDAFFGLLSEELVDRFQKELPHA